MLKPCLNGWEGSFAVYPRCYSLDRLELVVPKRLVEVEMSLPLRVFFRWEELEKTLTRLGIGYISLMHVAIRLFLLCLGIRTLRDFIAQTEEF